MFIRLAVGFGFSDLFLELPKPGTKPVGITVIEELPITPMGRLGAYSVFDGAPILFGPSGDFLYVCDKPVRIAAIHAIQLFYPVQIGEMTPVHNDEVGSTDMLNAPDRKADVLEEPDAKIQE